MIWIQKGDAPESLKLYKKAENAHYGGCDKDDIRDYLLREQGHLCAYCMQRIYKETMKIEHWYPESRMSDHECLDYSRMFACCPGHKKPDNDSTLHKKKYSSKNDTCDTHKGNSIIAINPSKMEHIQKIKYKSSTGEIYADDEERTVFFQSETGHNYEDITTFQHDIDKTLNLNEDDYHYLKQNRKAALDAVIIYLTSKQSWGANDLQKLIRKYEQPDSEGKKEPYAGIILWYLKKKVKQK